MKNTMNLQNYGVATMSTREMETTNGGLIFMIGFAVTVTIGLAVAAGAAVYSAHEK